MESATSKAYVNITNSSVSGRVSVECIDDVIIDKFEVVILTLGPTGAGKSAFIESLSNDKSLQISSNRLDSFTQSVSAYRLNNVTTLEYGSPPIVIVDVPGFADTKISQMGIISMLKEWMKRRNVSFLRGILYFTPMNIIRLPGSHRQVLKTFQALTGVKSAWNITIVSTMWDAIGSDRARERAEKNFLLLQDDDIWGDYLDNGSKIVKFHNTQESALSVLDAALDPLTDESAGEFNLEYFVRESEVLQKAPFGHHLYDDLRTRIQNLQLQSTASQYSIGNGGRVSAV